MKILFILEYYHPHIGGVETLFKTLVDQLTASGHQVTIITQRFKADLPTVEKIGTCTIRRYTFVNRYVFTIMAFFPALRYAFNHQLIHTTSYNAGFPAFFAGLFSRKKVIITFHEYWGDLWFRLPFMGGFQKRLHFWFEKILARLPFTRFVADSDSTKSTLAQAGVPEKKLDRIYCGLDYSTLIPKTDVNSNQTYTFIYFGRLGISKGLDILLNAAGMLVDAGTNFNLEIVVPTEPRDLLKKIELLIQRGGLASVVTLHHELRKKDLHQLIKLSDCVVIPSYSEGFGFVAAESVALGMPIISSHQGSLPEVVSGSFIAMDTFSPRGLRDAMLKAFNGAWQHKEIRLFPLKEFAQHYVALYEKVINE